jgi:hypothetical protein
MKSLTVVTGKSKTELLLDFTNVTQEQVEVWASKAIVAHLQFGWRAKGAPAEAIVEVAKLELQKRGPRTNKVEKARKAFQELTPEERKAYIQSLQDTEE